MTTKKNKASPQAAQDLLGSFISGLRDKFETDPVLETEKGVDIEVEGYGTFTILRGHSRNQKFIKAFRETVVPYMESKEAKEKPKDQPDPELIARNRQVFAEAIIVGLKTQDGQAIPYDDAAKQEVKQLLIDAPDLYELLDTEAANAANFRKRYEAEEKN
ncbi:hypothetical protein [Hymenobacter fodinae]|nr:hypothetical protein [Hymenobacter fodinae]